MIIQEHYFPKDARRCYHCGSYKNEEGGMPPNEMCIKREVMPEPKRREYGCEDSEGITAYLKMRRERSIE